MKKMSILLIAVLSVLFLRGYAAAGEKGTSGKEEIMNFDVYLLIGQSNMAGRGTMLLPEDTARVIEGVWLLDDRGVPVPARNPLNRYSSVRKPMGMQGINPGVGFSRKVAQHTGRRILLVVNALGGSSIRAWAKDAPLVEDKGSIAFGREQLYAEAVRRARQALAYGELKAILWHQGEADARNPEAYKERLKALVGELRVDLDAPRVPFIAGEINYWTPQWQGFNGMIRTISSFIPHSDWVSAEGAGMLRDEKDPHFDRDGQLLIGERYADKVLEMCYPQRKAEK